VTFRLASEREPEMRDVICQGCGAINTVKVGKYARGIITIFCKGCGKEIQLNYDRNPVDLKLKRRDEV